MKISIASMIVRLVAASVAWFCLTESVLAADLVKVRLFSSAKSFNRIRFLAPATLRIGRAEIPVRPPFSIEKSGANLICRRDSRDLKGMSFHSCRISPLGSGPMPISIDLPHRPTRAYLGQFDLTIDRDSKIRIVNVVKSRDYIESVVASEAPPGSPPEMLKAQAVLTQTLLSGFSGSIDDSTQLQRYAGYTEERPEVAPAVMSVWGSRLVYHNKPIQVFFHSTCAGGTSSAQSFFHLPPGSLPYLTHVTCSYCKDSPFYAEKQVTLPTSAVVGFFKGAPPVILTKDQSGRPLEIGMGERRMSGYDYWIQFGQKFGWEKMPGTRFSIENQSNGQTIIRSTGAGHGVGLCQWGAIGLAKAGKTYRQILKYYFPACAVLP
jgi:SpoIID/LytB domain protein